MNTQIAYFDAFGRRCEAIHNVLQSSVSNRRWPRSEPSRIHSPNMSLRAVLHLLAALHFWFGCYYDWNYVKIPAKVHRIGESFGNTGKLKFLTYWDALLQAFFFTICFINDISGNTDSTRRPSGLKKFKDMLLTCLAFPLSMFVGLTFWALYAVDRELVFPKAIDEFFPTWLNHVMHTNIMIFILLEMYTSSQRYPPKKVGISILGVFMLCYLVWIHIIHAYSGLWVYPVLDVLNFSGRIIFFLGLLGLSVSLYLLGEKLNRMMYSVSFAGDKDD